MMTAKDIFWRIKEKPVSGGRCQFGDGSDLRKWRCQEKEQKSDEMRSLEMIMRVLLRQKWIGSRIMKKLDLISGSSTSSKGELAWQLLRALSGLRWGLPLVLFYGCHLEIFPYFLNKGCCVFTLPGAPTAIASSKDHVFHGHMGKRNMSRLQG